MSDRKADKSKRPPECKDDTHTPDPARPGFVIWGSCPHLKTVSETWDTETLECAVCGLRYTLYDDEMR